MKYELLQTPTGQAAVAPPAKDHPLTNAISEVIKNLAENLLWSTAARSIGN